ncbi:hypothetical protein Hdeb2414_s0013g00412121 [Helianthus debilis subsp. tardiflorus]
MPSEYLLVNGEPKASMTANEVKFSDAISSIPRHWRRFSFSMRSKISGSAASRGVLPHTLTGSMVVLGVVVRERKGVLERESSGGGWFELFWEWGWVLIGELGFWKVRFSPSSFDTFY